MADISKLVVSLEAESSKLRKELERTNKRLKGWERKASRTLDKFKKNFASAFAVGGVAAFGAALSKATSKIVMEAANTNSAMKKLEAQIRSTGSAAGFTAKQIDEFSRELARATLASTQGVRDAAGALLSFKTISGDTFKQTLELSQDMVEVFGGSLRSAALQLGKALEDPVLGLTALRRVGVTFAESDQKLIKSLTKSGQLFKAQGIILEKIRGQIGGAGKAAAKDTLVGSLDSLGQAFDELFESIGNSGVARAAKTVIDGLTISVNTLKRAIAPDAQTKFFDLADERKTLQKKLERTEKGGLLGRLRTSQLKKQLEEVEAEMRKLQDRNIERIKKEGAAFQAMNDNRIAATNALGDAQDKVSKKLKTQKESFEALVKETRDAINFKPVNPLIKGTVLEASNALADAKSAESRGDQQEVLDKAQRAVEVIKSLRDADKISKQYATSLLNQAEELGVNASGKLLEMGVQTADIKVGTATIEWSDPTKTGQGGLSSVSMTQRAPLVINLGDKKLQTSIPAEDADKMRTELTREEMKRGSRC